jgi:hypothetical protein
VGLGPVACDGRDREGERESGGGVREEERRWRASLGEAREGGRGTVWVH